MDIQPTGNQEYDTAMAAIAEVVPFIKEHEKFRGTAYKGRDGKWTVGYGQTEIGGRQVVEGDTISEEDAARFVDARVRRNAAALRRIHPWTGNLGRGALAAVYDLAYNLGVNGLSELKSPNLNYELDSADMDADSIVWKELPSYVNVDGKPSPGLVRRRKAAIDRWGPAGTVPGTQGDELGGPTRRKVDAKPWYVNDPGSVSNEISSMFEPSDGRPRMSAVSDATVRERVELKAAKARVRQNLVNSGQMFSREELAKAAARSGNAFDKAMALADMTAKNVEELAPITVAGAALAGRKGPSYGPPAGWAESIGLANPAVPRYANDKSAARRFAEAGVEGGPQVKIELKREDMPYSTIPRETDFNMALERPENIKGPATLGWPRYRWMLNEKSEKGKEMFERASTGAVGSRSFSPLPFYQFAGGADMPFEVLPDAMTAAIMRSGPVLNDGPFGLRYMRYHMSPLYERNASEQAVAKSMAFPDIGEQFGKLVPGSQYMVAEKEIYVPGYGMVRPVLRTSTHWNKKVGADFGIVDIGVNVNKPNFVLKLGDAGRDFSRMGLAGPNDPLPFGVRVVTPARDAQRVFSGVLLYPSTPSMEGRTLNFTNKQLNDAAKQMDAKGGEASGADVEPAEQAVPREPSPRPSGGPRIVINPTTFKNKKDALCVAFNERFRIAMEQYGFEPKSEPTPAQRRFFADTAYADDEIQLRRTILARILTLDTSIS